MRVARWVESRKLHKSLWEKFLGNFFDSHLCEDALDQGKFFHTLTFRQGKRQDENLWVFVWIFNFSSEMRKSVWIVDSCILISSNSTKWKSCNNLFCYINLDPILKILFHCFSVFFSSLGSHLLACLLSHDDFLRLIRVKMENDI